MLLLVSYPKSQGFPKQSSSAKLFGTCLSKILSVEAKCWKERINNLNYLNTIVTNI